MRPPSMIRGSAALLALALAACGLDVPDLNNPQADSLRDAPTRAAIAAAATGLLIGHRERVAQQNGYVALLGILGRESYTMDSVSDPRFVNEMLMGPALDPSSPAFGGNFWLSPYANIHNAGALLDALEAATALDEAERQATRGYAETLKALDFLVVVNTRDVNGAPVDVDGGVDALAPIRCKDQVLAHVAQLLDAGAEHLRAGGGRFPFPLSSGFAGFDTPPTFLAFNRGVKARVDAYRGRWASVLAALDESFLSLDAPLARGVYHAFGAGSGDARNGLIAPTLYAHPSVAADAEAGDARVLRKIRSVPEKKDAGLTSSHAFSIYTSPTSAVPILRNEELILLRAEARIGLGDVVAAADDLNFIRVESGALPERQDLDAANVVDELLRQRRYSLLFEGGHRWIDMRRYGRLSALPLDGPGHTAHAAFPIPIEESSARNGEVACVP